MKKALGSGLLLIGAMSLSISNPAPISGSIQTEIGQAISHPICSSIHPAIGQQINSNRGIQGIQAAPIAIHIA